jgi:hypothetical protein
VGRRNAADELDRLVEARRGGRPPPAGPAGADLERLAAAGERLAESWEQAPPLDARAVWARVGPALRAAPRRDRRFARWRRVVSDGGTVPRRAALAASTVVAAGLLFALIAPGDSSAAFVADVERLSTAATDALEDEELTAGEQTGLATIAGTLLRRVHEDPGALADLDGDELDAVAVTLSKVEQRLLPFERPQDAPPPTPASGESAPPTASGAVSPEAIPPAERASAPAVADSLLAVRSVSGAVQDVRSSRGLGPTGAPGHATAGTLCGGADGGAAAVCGAAVQTALSICGGVASQSELSACEAAVDVAEHSCDLVQGPDRSACRIALRDLARSAADGLEGGARGTGGNGASPPGRGRGNDK